MDCFRFLIEGKAGEMRGLWEVVQERTEHEETQVQGATWWVYPRFQDLYSL